MTLEESGAGGKLKIIRATTHLNLRSTVNQLDILHITNQVEEACSFLDLSPLYLRPLCSTYDAQETVRYHQTNEDQGKIIHFQDTKHSTDQIQKYPKKEAEKEF